MHIVILMLILALFAFVGCSPQDMGIDTIELSHSDCPNGNINCEYLGNCGHYVDVDNNGICDHSE